MSVYDRFWKCVRKKKNVHSIERSLVPRKRGGKYYPKERVLRVYVTKKEPVEALSKRDLIPEEFEGIPVDVVETGPIRPLSFQAEGWRSRVRPVVAGVSAMHYKGTACTLGWFAIDKEDSELVILCNNHCGAQENKARIGDPYLQPSPYDGGQNPRDAIGYLKRFVPINFGTYNCPFRSFFGLRNKIREWVGFPRNVVDLAIIKPTVEVKTEIYRIGKVYGKRDPMIGDVCQKFGRTTNHTREGTVIGTTWSGDIQYGRGTVHFEDCAIIEKTGFSAGGDSSSAIVTDTEKPIFLGLLFAGSETHTIFCKTSNIEAVGKVVVLTED